jgi:predicted DNA-binding transcriptional regulator AlpA
MPERAATFNHPTPVPIQLPENQIMTSKPSLSEDQFVDMAFITRLLGVSDKWIYRLIKDGLFPKPIKLGRSSRWLQRSRSLAAGPY